MDQCLKCVSQWWFVPHQSCIWRYVENLMFDLFFSKQNDLSSWRTMFIFGDNILGFIILDRLYGFMLTMKFVLGYDTIYKALSNFTRRAWYTVYYSHFRHLSNLKICGTWYWCTYCTIHVHILYLPLLILTIWNRFFPPLNRYRNLY